MAVLTGSRWRRVWPVAAVALLAVAGLAAAYALPERQEAASTSAAVSLPVPAAAPEELNLLSPTPLARLAPAPEPPARLEMQLPRLDPNAAPWRRYAVPVAPAEGRPRIVIVIDDVGLNRASAQRTLALPGPLTISFMTYAEGLADLAATARAAGHELMLHVPMEPDDSSVDPGPRALRVGQSPAEILAELDWGLSRLEGYVGINNHMGSRFTADADSMRPVLTELAARGLLFLDSRTAPNSVGGAVAREMGVPVAERDVFLDHEATRGFVQAQLAETEAIALRRGTAIAIGHPYPVTLEALAEWLPSLAARGFQLVPISAVVRDPRPSPPPLAAAKEAG